MLTDADLALVRGTGIGVVGARRVVGLFGIGAGPVERVAEARVVTFVQRGAHHRGRGLRARSGLAGADAVAIVKIIGARRAVHLVGVGAGPVDRIAEASHVTFVEGGAHHGRGGLGTDARLAGAHAVALVHVVVAIGALGPDRVAAHARVRVAGPRVVAHVQGRAGYGFRGLGAGPALARVHTVALVAIVAVQSILQVPVLADAGKADVVCAGVVVAGAGTAFSGGHAGARVAGLALGTFHPFAQVVALSGLVAAEPVRTGAAVVAGAGRRAADPVVAIVGNQSMEADSTGALVIGAQVAVVGTGCAIRQGRVGAGAVHRIADTGIVTVVQGHTDHGWRGFNAATFEAGAHTVAEVAVVAIGAVGFHRVAALSACRVAGAHVVALVQGCADYGGDGQEAFPCLAGADAVALVRVVVTIGAVLLRRVVAIPGEGVATARQAARFGRRTGQRSRGGRADTLLTDVPRGAEVAVVAVGAFGQGGVTALTRGPIAGAHIMTFIEGGADHRVRTQARPGLAGGSLGAQVTVVASRTVFLDQVGAGPGQWVAGADLVALVQGRTHHRFASEAGAGLAGVAQGAGVQVVTSRTVGDRLVGAGSGGADVHRAGVAVARTPRALVEGDADALVAGPALVALHLVAGRLAGPGHVTSGTGRAVAAVVTATGRRAAHPIAAVVGDRSVEALALDALVLCTGIVVVFTGGAVVHDRIGA